MDLIITRLLAIVITNLKPSTTIPPHTSLHATEYCRIYVRYTATQTRA